VLTVVVVSGLEATRLRYQAAALVTRANATLGGIAEVTRVAIRVATPTESSPPAGAAGQVTAPGSDLAIGVADDPKEGV
jgi:hypothetical protein